jgi:Met-zincin
VMDYIPINLPRPGEVGGARHQLTLGPYDYWAIEYAYRPSPEAASPPAPEGLERPGKAGSTQPAADAADAQEKAMLQQIAARSAEPELAYGTDEDAAFGIDPETLVFDLGNDEVAFAAKRIAIARDLIARQENRSLDAGDDYGVLRRAVGFAMRDAARAAGILVRQIGGVRTLRDYPGSGRDPLSPVDPPIQRAALDVLAREILAPDAFAVSPALARRMAPDYFERAEAAAIGVPVATDFALAPVVVDLQRALLAQLMSDPVAVRITDNEQKVDASQPPFRLSEVYERLMREVWGDIDRRASQPLARRELQRDHVNRLASQLLKPDQLSRADARGLLRLQARALLPRLQAASRRPGVDAATRAHLEDSVETLQQALSARLARGGY